MTPEELLELAAKYDAWAKLHGDIATETYARAAELRARGKEDLARDAERHARRMAGWADDWRRKATETRAEAEKRGQTAIGKVA